MTVREEIEKQWAALPKSKRFALRIKQIVPEQRLWIKALYVLACEGDEKAVAAMDALFERRPRGKIVPRLGLRAPQQQRRIVPVALNFFVGEKLWKKD